MRSSTELQSMEVEVDPVLAVQLERSCQSQPKAISEAVASAFARMGGFLQQSGSQPVAPPRVIYTKYGPEQLTFTLAMPIASGDTAAPAAGEVRVGTLRGGRALRFEHHGPYSELAGTYKRIDQWLRERGGIKTDADWSRYSPMWEEYVREPGSVPDSQLLTYIYLPLNWQRVE